MHTVLNGIHQYEVTPYKDKPLLLQDDCIYRSIRYLSVYDTLAAKTYQVSHYLLVWR